MIDNGTHLHEICREIVLVSYRDLSRFFCHNIEFVFLAEDAPDHRDVLNDEIKGYGRDGAADAQHKAHHTETVEGERLDDTEHVHVDVDGAYERTQKVHDRRTRDRTQSG